jgi:hypothetical protein
LFVCTISDYTHSTIPSLKPLSKSKVNYSSYDVMS